MGKDDIADVYDSSSEYWLKKSRVSERYLAIIEASAGPDMTVLDLGCGGGRLSFLLAGKVKRIVGCDLSTVLIAGAKEKAVESPSLQFVQGDLEEGASWEGCMVANEGRKFDLMVSNVAIRKDALRIEYVLDHARKVLKEDGPMILRIESSGDIPEIGCPLPCYHSREIRSALVDRDYHIDLLEEERFSQRFSTHEAFSDFLERTGLSSFLEEIGYLGRALEKGRSLETKDGIRLTRSYWIVKARL